MSEPARPCLWLGTPSRLHFGLLALGPQAPRQFGGVGLMIDAPGLRLSASPSRAWEASGPLASRALAVAERAAAALTRRGIEAKPGRIEVLSAPAEHVGLGVGTQLGLGVARLVCELAGLAEQPAGELAQLSGRGLRSGIGLHGFVQGGLIVDGGRAEKSPIPALLARLEFPWEWSVLVVIPPQGSGLHGPSELRAFADLPPFPDALTDRLCRLVLLGLLPAVVERDLSRFSEALEELQERVGEGFAPAQGGVFARPELEALVGLLRAEGLLGVGQSSWGPTLYGFSDAPADRRAATLATILEKAALPPTSAFWTQASEAGAWFRRDRGSGEGTGTGLGD